MRTPVALFIFNRPEHTARVLEAIAAARPTVLFVVADGPRADQPDDERLVSETRGVIDRVDWPCDVRTCYSEVNLNCHRRIASGLDCLPDPTFFPYCEQLLERYRDDGRVHMISGSNPIGARSEHSYHFSRCYGIWGWATWARAWQHYDAEMPAWPRLRETRWLEDHLGDEDAATVARFWFDHLRQWDFQWMFSGWLEDALTATPSVNLVTNIGFGLGATHLHDAGDPFANVTTQPIELPLRHPPRVEPLESADRAIWEVLVAQFAGARRGKSRQMAAYLASGSRRARTLLGERLTGR